MSGIKTEERRSPKLLIETYAGIVVLAISGALIVVGFLIDGAVL